MFREIRKKERVEKENIETILTKDQLEAIAQAKMFWDMELERVAREAAEMTRA